MQGWSQEGRCCYVNLTAALTARMNAQANGYGGRVAGVGSNFSSALSPKPLVDVILANNLFAAGVHGMVLTELGEPVRSIEI